jgi:hypothetical protein
MSNFVDVGALCRCQFGSASSTLQVAAAHPMATARDFVPFINVQPFGACSCPRNPQVEQRGAAQPCVPAIDEHWNVPTSRPPVDGEPLCPGSTLRCRWGGVIHIVMPRRP